MKIIRCDKCGGVIEGDLTSSDFLCNCVVKNRTGMTGWVCPVCGAGLSPYQSMCPCKQKWEITWQYENK